jgi:hypothetical protein
MMDMQTVAKQMGMRVNMLKQPYSKMTIAMVAGRLRQL